MRILRSTIFTIQCIFSLFCLFWFSSSAAAEVIIIHSRTASGGITACPVYCELSNAWFSLGSSRYSTSVGASFSVQPTLQSTTGTYLVDVTLDSLPYLSSDILVAISVSGGSSLPLTSGFQYLGIDIWRIIGQFTLDGTTSAPTITFTQVGGTIGSLARFDADAVRFTSQPSPSPGLLSVSQSGGNVTLNWAGSFTLQSTTNLNDGFSDLPGPVTRSPYSEAANNAACKWFRLRQ